MAAALLCCCALVGTVATARAEQIPIFTYTVADGLAHNEIARIVRDGQGFLWFATAEGLSRFDGRAFVSYTTAQGLPHRYVRDILVTRRGAYWIATPRGICRLNVGSPTPGKGQSICTPFKVGDTEAAQNVFRLYEDRAGTIWIGTFGGVYRLDGDATQPVIRFADFGLPDLTDQRLVQDIVEDRAGSLWVATRGSGIYRRRHDGSIEHVGPQHGVPARVNALVQDRHGSLWAATSASGLLRLVVDEQNTAHVAARYTASNVLPSNWITRLFEASDGKLWVGTSRGLAALTSIDRSPRTEAYTMANGLTSLELSAIAEDFEGNLWIGTPSRGAMKMARNGFVTFGKADGLGIPAAGSIFEDRSADLYLFADGLLSRFDGKRFVNIRPRFSDVVPSFSWARDQIALQDRHGEWWFASVQGLYRFPNVGRVDHLGVTRPRAVYTTKNGLPGDVVYRVFEDSHDDIWIQSLSDVVHLTRWDRASQRFIEQTTEQGWVSDTWINRFTEDRSGNLWMATSAKGLARYRHGRFQFLTTANGLHSNTINALHVDRVGRLWMALAEGGVQVLEDLSAETPRMRRYSMAEGLVSDETIALTEDQWGKIYLLSGKGVDRLDPETGQIEHYTAADGLTYDIGLAYRDRQGGLWFGSNNELSRLLPEPERPSSPPAVFISGVRVGGIEQPVPMLGAIDLPELRIEPSENQIAIDFFGLAFRMGETLRYQYRLEGDARDWSPPTDQRSVNYAKVAPGHYRFLVRAVRADGVLSASSASVTFTILPPLWQRGWFIAGVMLVGLSAIGMIHRYRVRRLLEVHRMRMAIASELHDDIGANLSRVAILSELAKRELTDNPTQSTSLLDSIAVSARETADSMRDIVWAIDPRHNDLDEVVSRVRVFASSVLEARGIQWQLDVPKDLARVKLDPEQQRQIYLFFKEAVHNIVRHSQCRTATAVVEVGDRLVVCRISDDGRGLRPELSDPTSGRLGLAGLRARANALGGDLTVASVNGGGTTLTLTVPRKLKR